MSDAIHEKLRLVREKEGINLQMVVHLLAMKRFVVGDDCGLGKCVTGDTLIDTSLGLIPISALHDWSDMKPDSFAGLDHPIDIIVNGKRYPAKHFYYGGLKPTLKFKTRNGYGIETSRVHPLWVNRGSGDAWIKAQDIQVGDYLGLERNESSFVEQDPALNQVPDMARSVTCKTPSRLSPDMARFLGYYIGEGSCTSQTQVTISQCPRVNAEVHSDILGLLDSLFGVTPRNPDEKDKHVGSTYLRRFLAANGVGYTHSHDHVVPDCIFRATKESCRAFLKGLFEAEASCSNGIIEFSTSSMLLGKQVQIMLLRFGIVTNRKPKNVKGRGHVYWRLTVQGDDARRFNREIGFVSARKRDALAALDSVKPNPNKDTIPHARAKVEAVRSSLKSKVTIHKGGGLKQFGQPFEKGLNNIRHCGQSLTYAFARTLITNALASNVTYCPELDTLSHVAERHLFYDPVVEIVESTDQVFDLEIDHEDHAFVGNGFLCHNTLSSIAALTQVWTKNPSVKAVVLTKKSSVYQWESEFQRFTDGVRVIVADGTPQARAKAHADWEASNDQPTVLIQGYTSAGNDFARVQNWSGYILITDEATVFKTPQTRTHKVCRHLGDMADRVWALTATLIKNTLIEGYGIYRVVVPELFRMTPNAFQSQFSIVKMQQVARNRMVPVVVGYRDSDVRRFRDLIDPYYLGRPKHAVATELPVLVTRDVVVGLTEFQKAKYKEALDGLLEMADGDQKATDQLTSIIYCQEIVNHPALIGFETYDSEKLDALVDLLTEGGDLDGQKTIVFTRFRTMVDVGVKVLAKHGIKSVRVTGSEDGEARKKAMLDFQDPDNDTQVIWITMAGGDAINLQTAKALVFYDTPWSAGDYLQVLGRMIRIGSNHDRVFALHLVCKDTIDERVQEVRRKKMKLVESVLGQRVKGEGSEAPDQTYDTTSEVKDLFDALRNDARKIIP